MGGNRCVHSSCGVTCQHKLISFFHHMSDDLEAAAADPAAGAQAARGRGQGARSPPHDAEGGARDNARQV